MAIISTLLVDDNSNFLRAAMAFLAIDGRLKVVGTASSGREAIDKVALLTPDLVLMDWTMPEMDGPTAVRHLKSQTQPPCIIMLTQHDTEVYRAQAAEVGADGFVSKPEFGVHLMPLLAAVCPGLNDDTEHKDNASSMAA